MHLSAPNTKPLVFLYDIDKIISAAPGDSSVDIYTQAHSSSIAHIFKTTYHIKKVS